MFSCIFCFVVNVETSWNKLVERLTNWLDLAILNLPNLLLALMVFAVTYSLAKSSQKWLSTFLQNLVVQKAVRSLFVRILSILIIALGLFIALGILNLDGILTSLLAGAGVAGLIIGLALQGPLANTFSGVFLAFEDAINVGDFIETNGYSGTVLQINLKSTKLKEIDNNIVVIPNKMVLERPFKNYGLTERIRLVIKCGVAYKANLKSVEQLAVNTIKELYPPMNDENIEFHYLDFDKNTVSYQLRFWVDAKAKLAALEAKSNAIIAVKEAFEKRNIEVNTQ